MTDPADGGARGSETEGLAGVGAWRNHDDPVDEWPGIEEWTVEGIGAFLADAEDEYWSTYHRIAEAEGEDACGRIGSLYEAQARRILTGPELADLLTAARAEALRDAADEMPSDALGWVHAQGKPIIHAAATTKQWLRARADSIAATEGEHTLDSGPADGGVG